MTRAAPSDAALLLRRLRFEARLSQEELAYRSQVSERTVRGLESGVIRGPQDATLRALAEALGLEPELRRRFVRAWRLAAAGPVPVGAFFERNPLPGVGEELARQPDRVRVLNDLYVSHIGSDRALDAVTSTLTVIATQPGVNRYIWMQGYEPAAVDPDAVRVHAQDNCRIGEQVTLAPGTFVAELLFDGELEPGRPYTFSHRTELRGAYRPGGQSPPAEVETLSAVRESVWSVAVRCVFPPDRAPKRVWRVQQTQITDRHLSGEPVPVSAFGVAEIVVRQPEPGVHGLRWAWD